MYVIPKVTVQEEIFVEAVSEVEMKEVKVGITVSPWESTAPHMGDTQGITSYSSYLNLVNKYESNPGFYIDVSQNFDEISKKRGKISNFQHN